MLTLDKIYQASHVLRSVIRKTDLIQAPKLCPDCNLFLKTENLQVTGSFKVRGAYYIRRKGTGCHRLLCRQPRTGCGSGCSKEPHEGSHLPAGRCSDLQGRSYQELRCRGLHGQGCL